MNTDIKICGIMDNDVIDVLNKYRPEYIGFVFAQSRRMVTPARAKELAKLLHPDIKRVGVFVNESVERMISIRQWVGLDVMQLHGSESIALVNRLGGIIWKALPGKVDSMVLVQKYLPYVDKIVLDSMTPQKPGGTSQTFDWRLIDSTAFCEHLVLAGGLHAGNIKKAMHALRPSVVDISSGVETDGKKDPEKIRICIEEVRREP